MEEIATELVDEIIQNCEILDIIRLSHVNIFYNKEIKKIFLNNKKKTYKEYLGLNIIKPLELLYINKNHLQLTKIKEYKEVYYKLLTRKKIDLYTLYRIYNNFLKLFKEIHILTKDETIINNYYDLVRTLIILNERSYYLFSEEGEFCKKKMIIMSLLRIILLINPLNRHTKYQEDIRVLFYNFIEKIIKKISKQKDIHSRIFFIKFLRDYLFELDNNCSIISYVELYEFKKFIKTKLKENKLDIYFKN
jgi:hypothetical protein